MPSQLHLVGFFSRALPSMMHETSHTTTYLQQFANDYLHVNGKNARCCLCQPGRDSSSYTTRLTPNGQALEYPRCPLEQLLRRSAPPTAYSSLSLRRSTHHTNL